ELGCELDDEIGFLLADEPVRGGAGSHQPIVQLDVATFEEIDEAAVEAHQAVAAVKVLEPQIKGQRETCAHQSRRPQPLDMRPTVRAPPDPQWGFCCTRASKLWPEPARSPRLGLACPSIWLDRPGRARPIPASRCLRRQAHRRSKCDAPRRSSSAGIR